MMQKLKKVLYTVDASHPDAVVVVQSLNDGSVLAASIALYRAACVIARVKREQEEVRWIVPVSVLRCAKSLTDLAKPEIRTITPDDWRIKTLRELEEADKIAAGSVRVSDLRPLKELRTKSLLIRDPYCEFVIGKNGIESTCELGKLTIPAESTQRGRIGLNIRYLVDAVNNLIARKVVSVEVVRHKGTDILVISSDHERHYIVEMREKR
jgi:hypothetical protein